MSMPKCSFVAVIAAAATLVLLPAQDAVHVLASNGALEELQPQCERNIGHPVAVTFSSTAALKKKIEAGEAFDVTIIAREAITDLVRQRKLAGDSRVELGRSELGIGIRSGASKPDIHTVAALKETLRKAKSITFPQDGATRGNIERMFDRLGIATEIQPRIILAPSSGAATASVADGKAAMVITLFSEIVPVHGIEILGPLPGEFEAGVNFEMAVSSAVKNTEGAKALIAFLAGPKAAPAFKAKGIEHR